MAEQSNPLHSSGTDGQGSSPLHYAVKEANLALVKLLTDNETCDLNSRDIHGCTPLHYAAKEGHFDIVKVLTTSEKCDFNSQDKQGSSPLHYATTQGHMDVVTLLTSSDKIDFNCKDHQGCTPLHRAIEETHLPVVKLLISSWKCDFNARDEQGRSGLHYATRQGSLDSIKLLTTNRKCDYNIKDKRGCTPLHWAVRMGRMEVIKLLISSEKCDYNSRDDNGCTPLHYAARDAKVNVVQVLVSSWKCDINCKDNEGFTPLHYAARNADLDVVKQLISSEDCICDVNCVDKDGNTPLQYAMKLRNMDLVQLLKSSKNCAHDVDIRLNTQKGAEHGSASGWVPGYNSEDSTLYGAAVTHGEPTCTTALYKTATDDLKHRQWLDYNKPLNVNFLYEVNIEVVNVVEWFQLGLELGISPTALDHIKANFKDVERCKTEMLAQWLQGQGRDVPTWKTLVCAVRTVSKVEIARTAASKHELHQGYVYGDIDDTQLSIDCLHNVSKVVTTKVRRQWFHFGLALVLFYCTLVAIEADNRDSCEHCTIETLKGWLRKQDVVSQRGGPSWRSLTLALGSPLVGKQEIAHFIATSHSHLRL